ncbi:Uncharacterized protein OBRU01_25085 [Operophtera brumata]|uniref:Nuclease HARBI1 n=1 Tax=Operophtera brumata TaxID=104452 RepID=A0A0L7K3G6_OPEBR|nr:Uncharacterized protein OBRU01_26018 [Operophtera brumata]KOB62417.1 Uncharacterized protein OBRU01_25085 [Operophtera brumata]
MAVRILLVEYALEEERLERRRNRRRLRDSFCANLVPDLEFVANYRLSRSLYEELCQDIIPLLPRKRNRRAIDPATKILVALNFYARGSYQGSVGQNDDAPMAQQTVSRCIREVSLAINTPEILRKYIKFPQNATERNICDSDCVILNVDASYGGATHDAFIWTQCEIKGHLESLTETTYLLVSAPELTPDDFQAENSRQITYQPATSATDALRRGQRQREIVIRLLENI